MADYQPYASKGIAGAGLGLGIAGTALGIMRGGFGNLFGGCGGNVWNEGCGSCSEDRPVSRFELAQSERIAALEAQRDTLASDTRTDGKILDLYKYVEGRFQAFGREFADLAANQAVINQKVTDNLAFVDSKIDSSKREVLCYVNATFVPGKLVMPLDAICPPAQPATAPAAA